MTWHPGDPVAQGRVYLPDAETRRQYAEQCRAEIVEHKARRAVAAGERNPNKVLVVVSDRGGKLSCLSLSGSRCVFDKDSKGREPGFRRVKIGELDLSEWRRLAEEYASVDKVDL